MNKMKNIIIILSILLVGAFISQSIYWISLGKDHYIKTEQIVNQIPLEGNELKQTASKYHITPNINNECSCADSKYVKAYKVKVYRSRGIFPFYKDEYSKDSIHYPIMTKP